MHHHKEGFQALGGFTSSILDQPSSPSLFSLLTDLSYSTFTLHFIWVVIFCVVFSLTSLCKCYICMPFLYCLWIFVSTSLHFRHPFTRHIAHSVMGTYRVTGRERLVLLQIIHPRMSHLCDRGILKENNTFHSLLGN